MSQPTNIAAAAAVGDSLRKDLAEITTLLTEAEIELTAGNVNGAVGAAAAAETAVARVTALYPALMVLLRQQRP
ncbi:hypothetical protein TSH100_04065 [Azospirillum sp. TSH100]|uniref:hypothetical protein n=1 Tax=Azospirillum sp. TSH100 TaxID=652764 RepID=UPI000D617BE8|nr:hypothetical protein [Azospirillum sp. TSH100]PWC89822.1 hypothetical protein TSH100_04065 [Azospirillum sp. TSH100]QCG92361.1 hypothetical protein E6C72_31655 [Azospirillum sp. TSH100]